MLFSSFFLPRLRVGEEFGVRLHPLSHAVVAPLPEGFVVAEIQYSVLDIGMGSDEVLAMLAALFRVDVHNHIAVYVADCVAEREIVVGGGRCGGDDIDAYADVVALAGQIAGGEIVDKASAEIALSLYLLRLEDDGDGGRRQHPVGEVATRRPDFGASRSDIGGDADKGDGKAVETVVGDGVVQ